MNENSNAAATVAWATGKEISSITISDNRLAIGFAGESKGLRIFDDGQACCETRYMRTDDNLSAFLGAKLLGMSVDDAPGIDDGNGEEHEVQFLNVKTSLGVFTISNHNEHNGYYGGFVMTATLEDGEEFYA